MGLISKKTIFNLVLFLIFSFLNLSCATVPLSGRRQISFIPSATILSMSDRQYREFISENKLSSDQVQVERLRRVGQRIQKAVEHYMADKGLSHRLRGYSWEFNLVESDKINAWCMPGGRIVVYEGILSVAQDDAGLAVVIAHEIAHAVAEHGNERLSQLLIARLGEFALSSALRNKPEKTKDLWMSVYGVGAQYGALLPYSRLQEVEADYLGLIFMAIAGYDPNAAVAFWQRMAKEKDKGFFPDYLSTHPSDETRITKIKEKIPEAMNYYKAR